MKTAELRQMVKELGLDRGDIEAVEKLQRRRRKKSRRRLALLGLAGLAAAMIYQHFATKTRA